MNTFRGVVGRSVLADILEQCDQVARLEVDSRAAAIARTSLVSYETARQELAAYQLAGVDLEMAERAIRHGLETRTVIEVVEAMKEPERPAPTVEDLKAWAEVKAERAEERAGKWRGQGHAGQADRAVEKRRRRAKLARASRRRR